MTVEESLVNQYGSVLTLTDLAKILQRSPDGLRQTLRTSSPWVQQINAEKFYLGRRVYFRTSGIAKILTKCEAAA
jgi:hypothetical protein